MNVVAIAVSIAGVLFALLVGWVVVHVGVQAIGVVLVLWLAWRGRRYVRRAARRDEALRRLYDEAAREGRKL